MNKQIDNKTIEEMAKIIGENSWEGITRVECYVCAEALYNEGCRITDSNNVIVSKEELSEYETAYDKVYAQAKADILGNMKNGGSSCVFCEDATKQKIAEECLDFVVKNMYSKLEDNEPLYDFETFINTKLNLNLSWHDYL